jgi:hypothetical protein
MKKIVLIALLLSGCDGAPPVYVGTSPGSALPDQRGLTVNWCDERDTIGRCKKWHVESDVCINPKGINVEPPAVWCNYIKNGVVQDKPVDGVYHDKK